MFRFSGIGKVAAVLAAGLVLAGPAFAQGWRQGGGDGQNPQFQRRQPLPQVQQAPAPAARVFQPQYAPRPAYVPQQPRFAPPVQVQRPVAPAYTQPFQPRFHPRPQAPYDPRAERPRFYPQPVPIPAPVYEPYPVYQPYPVYEDYPVYRSYPRLRARHCVIRRVWVDTRFGPRRVKKRVCR